MSRSYDAVVSQVYCAIASCNKRELKYCGNTTNLGNHLKSKHLSIYRTSGLSNDRNTRDRENDDTGSSHGKIVNAFITKLPSSSKKAKQLTDAVGYFIAKDMQPIRSSKVLDLSTCCIALSLVIRFRIEKPDL